MAYKLDLAEPTLKIGIEVDGPGHLAASKKAEDARKDSLLASLGWRILRVRNKEVLDDLPAVLDRIASLVASTT